MSPLWGLICTMYFILLPKYRPAGAANNSNKAYCNSEFLQWIQDWYFPNTLQNRSDSKKARRADILVAKNKESLYQAPEGRHYPFSQLPKTVHFRAVQVQFTAPFSSFLYIPWILYGFWPVLKKLYTKKQSVCHQMH